MKETYPKWLGFQVVEDTFKSLLNILNNINEISEQLSNDFYLSDNISDYISDNYMKDKFIYPVLITFANEVKLIHNSNLDKNETIRDLIYEINRCTYSFVNNYIQLVNNRKILNGSMEEYRNSLTYLEKNIENMNIYFGDYKSKFIKDFTHYIHLARAFGKILPIIYFSLLLTFVVGSGALLITYFCKKHNQQWWVLPMHIAWNGIRFFIFSFFLYGCAFGMLFLFSRDSIAYLQYAFSSTNLNSDNPVIIPSRTATFFDYCLYSKQSISNDIIYELTKNIAEINNFLENKPDYPSSNTILLNAYKILINGIEELFNKLKNNVKGDIEYVTERINKDGNIYAHMNCSYLNSTINIMYRAMWDFSWETRILCALSCCISFFGIIAVYSFLWVMHLWKRDDGNAYSSSKNKNFYNSKNNKKTKKFISPPKDYDNNEGSDEESMTELPNKKYNDD